MLEVPLVVEVWPQELSSQWEACFKGVCLNCGLWEVRDKHTQFVTIKLIKLFIASLVFLMHLYSNVILVSLVDSSVLALHFQVRPYPKQLPVHCICSLLTGT